MKNGTMSTRKPRELFVRWYRSVEESPRAEAIYSWVLLLLGLAVWSVIQTVFTVVPIWDRALPMGVHNGFPYLVEATRLENCLSRDCPALADLQRQLESPSSDPEIERQRRLAASSVFLGYPTLVAPLLLIMNQLGLDLMGAYRVLYSIGPLWFGLAFAYLLSTLWGMRTAGISLLLLAFKLFPEAGLNYGDPSTIAMGMAAAVWARIVARRGEAPWALVVGSLALVGIHPIGALYAVIAAVIAISMSGWPSSRTKVVPVLLTCFMAVLSFVISGIAAQPPVPSPVFRFDVGSPVILYFLETMQSVVAITREMLSVEAGLFGSMTIFWGVVAFGFFVSRPEIRATIVKIIVICAFFFLAFTLFRPHRGDLISDIWVPIIVVLVGGVGRAFLFGLEQSFLLLVQYLEGPRPSGGYSWDKVWPVLAFALILGYSFQTAGWGIVHLAPIADYLRNRQPVALEPTQTELLRSTAKSGDSVLYTSTIIMPYYLIHGAMEFGAIYHNPSLSRTQAGKDLLHRPGLRFAAIYNPLVYHPTFEGSDEDQWWITRPPLRFSPLNKGRTHGPISQDGMIPVADLKWMDIKPRTPDYVGPLKVMIKNPGPPSQIQFVPMTRVGEPIAGNTATHTIAAGWEGEATLDTETAPRAERFRIIFPEGEPRFFISAIVFGSDVLHWPWAQKADLSFVWKNAAMDPVVLSFDPVKMLPPPLNQMSITVLDDKGSSVLLRIDDRTGPR